MTIQYGIPSYGRAGKVQTLDWLESMGVGADRITISTQTKEDYNAYHRHYGIRANVIYREARNAAGNRNTLLDAFDAGTQLVMLDDDVRRIIMLTAKGKRRTVPPEKVETLIQGAYGTAIAACPRSGTCARDISPRRY